MLRQIVRRDLFFGKKLLQIFTLVIWNEFSVVSLSPSRSFEISQLLAIGPLCQYLSGAVPDCHTFQLHRAPRFHAPYASKMRSTLERGDHGYYRVLFVWIIEYL